MTRQSHIAVEQEQDTCQSWSCSACCQIEQAALAGAGGATQYHSQQVVTHHQHDKDVKNSKAKCDHVAFQVRSWRAFGGKPTHCNTKRNHDGHHNRQRIDQQNRQPASATAGATRQGEQGIRKMKINSRQHHQPNPLHLQQKFHISRRVRDACHGFTGVDEDDAYQE